MTSHYLHQWWFSCVKHICIIRPPWVNTLRPRQNGRHFLVAIFNCYFLDENVWILIKISLNFVPKFPINNIRALVQIMAWRQPGNKPSSELLMVSLLMHICVNRPQWIKESDTYQEKSFRLDPVSYDLFTFCSFFWRSWPAAVEHQDIRVCGYVWWSRRTSGRSTQCGESHCIEHSGLYIDHSNPLVVLWRHMALVILVNNQQCFRWWFITWCQTGNK